MDGMYAEARKVFGIVGVNRAAVCEKTMESIIETAKEYLPDKLFGKRVKLCVSSYKLGVFFLNLDSRAF